MIDFVTQSALPAQMRTLLFEFSPLLDSWLRAIPWFVWVAFLSNSLYQASTLFIYRTPPRRFIPAIISIFLWQIVEYGLWICLFNLSIRYGSGGTESGGAVTSAVHAAYRPFLFSAFKLIPFFGKGFGWGISGWSAGTLSYALSRGAQGSLTGIIVLGGIGWLYVQTRQQSPIIHLLVRWFGDRSTWPTEGQSRATPPTQSLLPVSSPSQPENPHTSPGSRRATTLIPGRHDAYHIAPCNIVHQETPPMQPFSPQKLREKDLHG